MKFGLCMFPTDYSMSPTALAVAAEDRGFESIWLPEHSHIPISRKSAWPGGDELPKRYYDCMDPFVSLGAAAAVTKSLMLGTGICLVIQRDPIQVAKEVATLDQISNGRVLFGVGGGWNADEIANHGTEFKTRFKVMRERINAIKAIWTETEAEFHGEYVDFDPIMAWPKPVKKPHPPIIVGGGFPWAAKRAAEYGNGWIPIAGREVDIVDMLPEYRQFMADAGREGEPMGVSVFGIDPATVSEADIDRYREAGVERMVVMLLSEEEDKILPLLDRVGDLITVED